MGLLVQQSHPLTMTTCDQVRQGFEGVTIHILKRKKEEEEIEWTQIRVLLIQMRKKSEEEGEENEEKMGLLIFILFGIQIRHRIVGVKLIRFIII